MGFFNFILFYFFYYWQGGKGPKDDPNLKHMLSILLFRIFNQDIKKSKQQLNSGLPCQGCASSPQQQGYCILLSTPSHV